MNDPRTSPATVRILLMAAGLELPDEELAAVASGYPALRARLDAVHTISLEGITPDLTLRSDAADAEG